MATSRGSATQSTAESQSHHLPKASGKTRSPGGGRNGSAGNKRQLKIRNR